MDVKAKNGRYDFNNKFNVCSLWLRASWKYKALNSDSSESKQA